MYRPQNIVFNFCINNEVYNLNNIYQQLPLILIPFNHQCDRLDGLRVVMLSPWWVTNGLDKILPVMSQTIKGLYDRDFYQWLQTTVEV